MNINILGVGRSGTTFLYTLIQKLMQEQLEGELRFYYEPFLLDADFLGADYEEAALKKRLVDSLSHGGIQAHLDLPLLIRDPAPYLDNQYLNQLHGHGDNGLGSRITRLVSGLSKRDPQVHRLVKYIRASGRYSLIERVSAPSKSVFVLRNPYAVANAIKNRFSFYGGEFHRDDAARLVDEVNDIYGRSVSLTGFENEIDLQLFYWLTMNRFALESFKSAASPPHVMQIEEFQSEPERAFDRLCAALGFMADEHYHAQLNKRVGPITNEAKLSKEELRVTRRYLEDYYKLLEDFSLTRLFDCADVSPESDCVDIPTFVREPSYGLHARELQKLLSRRDDVARETSVETSLLPFFAHVVNPVIVGENSDLKRAQPITFETMSAAARFADASGVRIEQLAVSYAEDEDGVPDYMKKCQHLARSCLDFGEFERRRKLPLFQDIFERALSASDAEYLIYTNVDIALMPHFYVTARELVRSGVDAITIFRRTLSSEYESVAEVPMMYADMGGDHPGTDCFIMKRSLVEKLDLEKIVIGAQFCAFGLRAHLHTLTTSIVEYPRLHMTFHIGDDRAWEQQDEYSAYNLDQLDHMFERLLRNPPVADRSRLDDFFSQYQRRKARWIDR